MRSFIYDRSLWHEKYKRSSRLLKDLHVWLRDTRAVLLAGATPGGQASTAEAMTARPLSLAAQPSFLRSAVRCLYFSSSVVHS